MQTKLFRNQSVLRLVLILTGLVTGYIIMHMIVEKFVPDRRIDLKQKKLIRSSNEANFRYYYEPAAGSTEIWNPSWLKIPVENHINADSLNEPVDYPRQKPPRTFRIEILGDSFTYGHFVPVEENYSEKLEVLLNTRLSCPEWDHFDVLNLGVPGYDIAYSIERLAKRGVSYNPDLVLWLVNYWNMETINEERTPLQVQFSQQGIPVFNEKTRLNDAVIMAMEAIKKKYGMEGILSYQARQFKRLPAIYSGDLLIFSFPGMPEKSKNIILDFIKTEPKATYWDGMFDYESHALYQLYDHHPNALGHTRIAEDIFAFLSLHTFSRCRII